MAKLDVRGLPDVQELLRVLVDNLEQLPDPVLETLRGMSLGKELVWSCETIQARGHEPMTCSVEVNTEPAEVVRAFPFAQQVELTSGVIIRAWQFSVKTHDGVELFGWSGE